MLRTVCAEKLPVKERAHRNRDVDKGGMRWYMKRFVTDAGVPVAIEPNGGRSLSGARRSDSDPG
jgi:hypothetical protein